MHITGPAWRFGQDKFGSYCADAVTTIAHLCSLPAFRARLQRFGVGVDQPRCVDDRLRADRVRRLREFGPGLPAVGMARGPDRQIAAARREGPEWLPR